VSFSGGQYGSAPAAGGYGNSAPVQTHYAEPQAGFLTPPSAAGQGNGSSLDEW
jgi:hypothetical protein